MLKLKNIIWMGALALAVTSCEDYMETAPENLLSSTTFYQTATQSEQGVVGVYADLGTFSNSVYWYMSECRSDNTWTEVNTNGLREYAEISTFRATDNLGIFNDVWNQMYKLIYDANIAISKIEGCTFNDETIKKQFLGEMHFMRGWIYFELTRLFGNVPLIDSPISTNDVKTLPQSTPREIIDNVVIPDLKYAIDNLPYKSGMKNAGGKSISSQGRADKMAAEAMLARVYVTLAGFPYNDSNAKALAKTLLETVLQKESDYFAPTLEEWKKQWLPSADYYNKYSIFAIQHRLGEDRCQFIFNMLPELPPSYTSWRMMGNSIFIEKTLAYEFERIYSNGNKDGRGVGYSVLEGFEAEGDNYNAYSNQIESVTLDDGTEVEVFSKSRFYKFMPSIRKLNELGMSFNEGSMKNYYDWPVNYPILRMEDMMLMYAEILAETNVSGAMAYVNKIRERAGIDPESATTATEALKIIKRERRVELMGEGIRWFDMVRYGEWDTLTKNLFARYNNPEGTSISNIAEGRYLYPIPLNQMNATPGLYKQNKGY